MRDKRRRTVIATVESGPEPKETAFAVYDSRRVTLTFPKATYGYGGYHDFVKAMAPAEARAIGRSLIDAADRVTAAEHVDD